MPAHGAGVTHERPAGGAAARFLQLVPDDFALRPPGPGGGALQPFGELFRESDGNCLTHMAKV